MLHCQDVEADCVDILIIFTIGIYACFDGLSNTGNSRTVQGNIWFPFFSVQGHRVGQANGDPHCFFTGNDGHIISMSSRKPVKRIRG